MPVLLNAAKLRLRDMGFVLVTERLGETGPLLEKHLGWAIVDAEKQISGTVRPHIRKHVKEFPEMAAEVRSPNLNGMQLHGFASVLFDQPLEGAIRLKPGGLRVSSNFPY